MKPILFTLMLSCWFSTLAQQFQVEYLTNREKANSIEVIGDYVWAGTKLGLIRINKANPQEMELIIDPFIDYKLYSCFSLYVEESSANELFIHHYEDLFRFSDSTYNHVLDNLSIIDIYGDENNAMWLLNGHKEIIRMDEAGVTRISHENSMLPDYEYNSICVENNVIWLGTEKHGIIRLMNDTVTEFNLQNGSLPDNRIFSITIGNGVLWALCYEEHFTSGKTTLIKYSEEGITRYDFTNSPVPNYWDIRLHCINNKLYMCCPGQLLEFDGLDWTTYAIPSTVIDVALDGEDIWVATDDGVALISDNQVSQVYLPNACFNGLFIGPIAEDLEGSIWVGTGGSGGNLCKKTGDVWTEVIRINAINYADYKSIAVDSNNVVWAMTPENLYRIEGDSVQKFTKYNSVLKSNFRNITVDKYNNKWINTDSQLVKFNDTVWTIYDNSDYDHIGGLSLATDHTGKIWMGIYHVGLVMFDGTNWTEYGNDFFHDDWPEIRKIIVDKEDNLWMDYYGRYIDPQICKFNGDTLEWFHDNVNLPERGSGLQDIDNYGNIWYGSSAGLAKYDWNAWTLYSTDNTRLLNNTVYSFYIDRNENKWISSRCYLAKFNEEDIINWKPDLMPVKESSRFIVYPNPNNSGLIYINVDANLIGSSDIPTEVTIIDILGHIQFQKQLSITSGLEIDISNLSNGLYVIKFKEDDKLELHKFIKL